MRNNLLKICLIEKKEEKNTWNALYVWKKLYLCTAFQKYWAMV